MASSTARGHAEVCATLISSLQMETGGIPCVVGLFFSTALAGGAAFGEHLRVIGPPFSDTRRVAGGPAFE